MRLLFVIDHLNSGGAQRQLVNLAIGLHRKNHHIEFFVYHPHDFFARRLTERGIEIHRSCKRSRFSTDVVFALRKLIAAKHFDFVISFLKTPNIYAELAKMLCGSRAPRLIVSERHCESSQGRFIYTRGVRQLHRLADYVTANSHHQRKALESKYKWMRKRICTIYNGVDLSLFHPDRVSPTSSAELKILAVASVSELKNGLRLIQALDVARRAYQIAPVVHWVGEHQHHIPARRNTSLQWHAELKRLNLESQWVWHDRRDDIPDLMRSYDALIHPSFREGLPNAVCEALASGLPALVSDILDNPLLVQDGRSGFLFDPYSPESIAKALFRFSSLDAEARQQMGREARSFAERELGLDKMVDHYEQLLLNLMTESVSGQTR